MAWDFSTESEFEPVEVPAEHIPTRAIAARVEVRRPVGRGVGQRLTALLALRITRERPG
jgi:hypothetical protein